MTMNFFRGFRNRNNEALAIHCMKQGKFDEAVQCFSKIDPLERRVYILGQALFGYASSLLLSKEGFKLIVEEDRVQYDLFRATVGVRNKRKCMIYRNSETDTVEGLDEVIRDVIKKDNPVLIYLDSLLATS